MTEPIDDPLLRAIQQWSAEMRVEDARDEIAQRRWQGQIAGEEMRLSGLLLDLHERGNGARVTTSAGRSHYGMITAVGADFIAVTPDSRPTVLIRTSVIAAVELESSGRGFRPPSGREVPETARKLEGVLAELLIDRTNLRFSTEGSDELRSGELAAVGNDIVAFLIGRPAMTTLFVPIDQLTEILLAG